jgi:hypothetical protein
VEESKTIKNAYARCPYCGYIEKELNEENSEQNTTWDYTVYCSGKGCGQEYLYSTKK